MFRSEPCYECESCRQLNIGQQGEYPCEKCGLPTQWDNGLESDLRKLVMDYVLDQGVYMLLSDREICEKVIALLDRKDIVQNEKQGIDVVPSDV